VTWRGRWPRPKQIKSRYPPPPPAPGCASHGSAVRACIDLAHQDVSRDLILGAAELTEGVPKKAGRAPSTAAGRSELFAISACRTLLNAAEAEMRSIHTRRWFRPRSRPIAARVLARTLR
jgi:hypothetical protein